MSPSNDYITVGQLAKPFGLQGDIKAWPATHDLERCHQLKSVLLQPREGEAFPAEVVFAACHGQQWVFRFAGYSSPEQARALTGAEIMIPKSERLPLPEGQFYFSDLEGLAAIDSEGRERGTVVRVEDHPSVNVFVLRIGGKEYLAPWIDDCIGEVNLETRTVQVHFDYLGELGL